jgi:hypothetical protein
MLTDITHTFDRVSKELHVLWLCYGGECRLRVFEILHEISKFFCLILLCASSKNYVTPT